MRALPERRPSPLPEFLVAGTVRKPHGIRGELLVAVATDRPESVFVEGRRLHLGDAEGRTRGGVLTIARARPHRRDYLIVTREHAGRTEALEALRGTALLLAREEAEDPEPGAFFYHELTGLRVVAGDEDVGVVRHVHDPGTGEMLEVERRGRKTLLIPLVQAIVRRVDVETGVLEIEPPPGLLELP